MNTKPEAVTALEVAVQLRSDFQQALHNNDLAGAQEALRKLDAIKQPLRDPDLTFHARQMTTLAERALHQAFAAITDGQERAAMHERYTTVRMLWYRG